jgi:hypothetical protein
MSFKPRFDPFYTFCSNDIVIIVTYPAGRGSVTQPPPAGAGCTLDLPAKRLPLSTP